jgi:hypothetical protein
MIASFPSIAISAHCFAEAIYTLILVACFPQGMPQALFLDASIQVRSFEDSAEPRLPQQTRPETETLTLLQVSKRFFKNHHMLLG